MRSIGRTIGLALAALSVAGFLNAEPLEKVARKLEKGLAKQTNRKVAVLNFPYHDGSLSDGSSIVQERLTTFLVQGGKVEVIERKLLQKVMDEMKLGTTGVLDQATTQELGKVLGVGAVVSGTLNDLDEKKTEVNARVIQAETGQILAAAQAQIKRSWPGAPVKPVVRPVVPPQGDFLGKPLVQIAVLLDTSNSMDGLINQARTQIWKIVNELSSAEKGQGSPELQVALYEYGNDALSPETGHVRQVLPFTKDLDHVSEKLFSLKTNGGQEYCGAVIRDALRDLKWDAHADVYRAIFIAGNEPFTQGATDFRTSVAEAARKGIAVNTIFCGRHQEGVQTQWKAGAELGGGEYMSIDQEARVAQISAPQDDEIARLSGELNSTYVAYGSRGGLALSRQAEQDKSALAAGGAASVAERTAFKASAQYKAESWDLVDAAESGSVRPEDMKKEDLPAEMQQLDAKERTAYLGKMKDKRKSTQERIRKLSEERQKYLAEQERTAASQGAQTLGSAMIKAIRGQASKRGFKFKK